MDLDSRVNQLLTNFYASFSSGLPTGWEDSLADDVVVIGTDQAEWLQGKDQVVPVLQAQMTEMSEAGMRVEAGERRIGAAGGAVWVADAPTMWLADDTALTMRLTAVATTDGERLQVKQLHVSVGVPNEDVLRQTLTV
jgi:hypothetical protein